MHFMRVLRYYFKDPFFILVNISCKVKNLLINKKKQFFKNLSFSFINSFPKDYLPFYDFTFAHTDLLILRPNFTTCSPFNVEINTC